MTQFIYLTFLGFLIWASPAFAEEQNTQEKSAGTTKKRPDIEGVLEEAASSKKTEAGPPKFGHYCPSCRATP